MRDAELGRESRVPSGSGGLLRQIGRLAAGDIVGKVLGFLAFVYLARVLGAERYGTLEFALSLLLYLSLLADGGLELWATREAARTDDPAATVARVLPARLAFSVVAYACLLLALPLLPGFDGLTGLLMILGSGFLVQALSLKWVFLSQERMGTVAAGTVLTQLFFAGGVVLAVPRPDALIAVAVLKVGGDLAGALYYDIRYFRRFGLEIPLREGIHGWKSLLASALPLGASRVLGLLSYNFDSLFLGFLRGATPVGWYNAAYKPVLAVLSVPLSYFTGVFPSLSRAYDSDRRRFQRLLADSTELAAAVAVPVGICGSLLADPLIGLVFGDAYQPAVPALMVLSWSAALVVLRGTLKAALKAADQVGREVKCAAAAIGLNVVLNLVLIPVYGIVGAATATLVSEALWFALLVRSVRTHLTELDIWRPLLRPAAGGAVVAALLLMAEGAIPWMLRGALAVIAYGGLLWASGWRPRLAD